MRTKVTTSGFKELDAALRDLPRATQRTVLRNTLRKAGAPIAEAARQHAPRDTGELVNSIVVSPKIVNTIGNAEFAQVMKAGGSRQEASAALRGARRAAKGEAPTAVMYVGPAKAETKRDAIKRIVQEFGSVHQPGTPYMRPAWDAQKMAALQIVANELGDQIERAARRIARKKAKAGG